MSLIGNAANKGFRYVSGFKKPLAIAGLVGSGAYAVKRLAGERANYKVDNNASGYSRHLARNLRSGHINLNNLSEYDYKDARNMYKISSQDIARSLNGGMDKVAFIGLAMNAYFAKGILDNGKEYKKKYGLNKVTPGTPEDTANPGTQLGSSYNYSFGKQGS